MIARSCANRTIAIGRWWRDTGEDEIDAVDNVTKAGKDILAVTASDIFGR